MALLWTLTALSLFPLLHAQDPVCTNFTTRPITNASLDRLYRKWFLKASVFRKPEYKQHAEMMKAAFFYFSASQEENTILLREYVTIEDRCVYNSTSMGLQRENGTISIYEGGHDHFGHLLYHRDPGSFFLGFFMEKEHDKGLVFYTDKPKASLKQMNEFHEALTCLGINKTEVMYTNWKKDLCRPLERQHMARRRQQS